MYSISNESFISPSELVNLPKLCVKEIGGSCIGKVMSCLK